MKIRKLPGEFIKHGFLHTQLERCGDIALYQRGKDGNVHYEVIKIKSEKPHPAYESEFDLVEVYPRSEDWGHLGFTYTTLEDATNKFLALRRRQGAIMTLAGNQNV